MLAAERLFVVSCRHCREVVAMAARLEVEEFDALLAHVRTCRPGESLSAAAGVDAVLRHFKVRLTDPPPQ